MKRKLALYLSSKYFNQFYKHFHPRMNISTVERSPQFSPEMVPHLFQRKQHTNLKKPTIPTEDNLTIYITHSTTKSEIISQIVPIAQRLIPGWNKIKDSQIQLSSISGALTNSIFIVENTAISNKHYFQKILLRVYGQGVDQFIDRENEINLLSKLSVCNVGPKLLGIFKNGRFEQYFDSTTLTHSLIRDSDTSRHIASRMCELHNIVKIYPVPKKNIPEIWKNIDKWLPSAENAYRTAKCVKSSDCYSIDFDYIKRTLPTLKKTIQSLCSPIVFCHNDAQYGNILKLKGSNELVVVDFEYSGYNYRGFDIANHFCEWMANYHSDAPHKLNPDHYPTISEQENFLKSYLRTQFQQPGEFEPLDFNYCLKELLNEVRVFTLTSHLKWGLWGVIQASQSSIDFDYMAYGTQRLHMFELSAKELFH